ncbi:hypothetical protein FJZ48_04360, partial [Candidatus Uhrbacteria bacterium]|nr:hypothetical protein [Candidatus Uhrbacteria bacterium]
NPDKEFWGQGLVQIIAPLLNGFPCTGALARTATSIKAGAVSPLAGYFKGILKLGMAYFIAQYLELIPMACIGGILLWVATNMIKVSEIKWVLTQGRFHSALMVYTAVMVPMTDFLTGVLSALIIYGVGVMYFKSQLHVEVFSTRRIEEFIMKQHKIQGSMMNSNKSIKKVILAVDAHGENEAVQKRILEQVQILLSGTQIEVEPVFVLHFDIASIASGLEVEELKGWSEKANQSISKMLRGLRFPKLLVPKILEALEPSKTACVKALDSYARETNVDLIIVGTHGRSGVPRLFLGSFSESLLLHANMPVLVVGPHSESTGKLNRILFPTDFSKPSERLLELVLSLAVQLKAALTIFHAIPHRYIEGISAETPVLAHMHKIIETREKQARAYADIARKRGLDADVVVEVTEGSIDQSILDTTVKIKAEMIAMAAHSGAVSSAFLGSVTRQVVRSASCPVWVLRERRSEG